MGIKSKDKERHPLQFAYVKITLLDREEEWTPDFKVWYIDDRMIRVREITLADGVEVEGDNLWIPWSAICCLREIEA